MTILDKLDLTLRFHVHALMQRLQAVVSRRAAGRPWMWASGHSPATVKRDWTKARAFLFDALQRR